MYVTFLFFLPSVPVFLKTTDWIETKFYMDLFYAKAQRNKQDLLIGMHNFA